MEFNNGTVEIYPKNEANTQFVLVIKHTKGASIAPEVNRVLKKYSTPRFQVGDEVRFTFNKAQIESIGQASVYMRKVLRQVFK